MPSVAQESPTVQSSKKRRRDDNSHQIPPYASFLATCTSPGTNHLIISAGSASSTPRVLFPDKTFDHSTGLFHPHHSSPLLSRKIIPIPSGKRQRTISDRDVEAEDEPMQRSPPSSPSHRQEPHHNHHHQQQQQRQPQARNTSQGDVDGKSRPATPTATSALMSRCHICSRKPNKKSDLDSFADCEGCGQRTCYVCIRECLGWGPSIQNTLVSGSPARPIPPSLDERETSFTMLDADAEDHRPQAQPTDPNKREHQHGWTKGGGHRQVVCSRCCVERGQDGEVVCLGCLPFVEG